NTLNLGDSLTLSFLSCSEDGVVLSGTMSISITQVTPNLDWTPPYALEVNVDMENFTVNDGGSVTTTNGDMLMLLAEDLGGNEYIQLSGTSLTASAGGQAERLTSYYFLIGGNNNTGDFGVILNATYASTKIDGSVSFTTVTPFTGNDLVANGEATAGELHITTSADSSQAWLIAQPDGINVQIDIDSDGDNTVDNTVMTTWTELMSL
ncbi:MAG: hypothetical protein KZQ77_13095, partial [Candidatus Thiodiazotropha sp. (ex Notomyrtea botanica)]|nr:hypothetical protein [Candidatus Thiodiazotropha sp. (ex Notomyrtea botanica)]